jgi:methionine-rich copper-binding protein CopC
MRANPKSIHGLVIAAILAASALPSSAQISVENEDSLRTTSGGVTSFTKSFDAGATADKLIVSAAYEGGPANSALTITYDGVELTKVPGTSGNRNEGIWYLDNPFTGGAADIVIEGGGTNFGAMGMGIVSIAGSSDGYAVAGKSGSSVTLDVPVADCFVFANCAANNGVIPTPAAPLVQLYRGALNSSEGAAGYAEGVASGSQSFSFTGSLTSPETSAAVFVPTTAAPVIVGTSPADDATNVAAGANLVATFTEPVVAGTGNITLHLTSNDSVVETFDVTTDVTFSGQDLIIDPASNLTPGAGYYIRIAATAVIDTSGGDSFAGITDSTTWNFEIDSTPPSIATLSPADNANGVQLDSNLVVTFDEAVAAGTGNITLHLASNDSVVETFDVTADVVISGSDLTINPTSDLTSGVGYYVQIADTAIDDTSGNSFAGIADTTTWNFNTDGTPPSIATLSRPRTMRRMSWCPRTWWRPSTRMWWPGPATSPSTWPATTAWSRPST